MAPRKNKAFGLLSLICAAAVLGVSVFSASASETTIIEDEVAPPFRAH
jgi:hypothetical protein